MLLVVVLAGCRAPIPEAEAPPPEVDPHWREQVEASIANAAYRVQDTAAGLRASNPANHLELTWTSAGLRLDPPKVAQLLTPVGGGFGFELYTAYIGRSEELLRPVQAGAAFLGRCRPDGALLPTGECLRRVERSLGGDAVEWYENRTDAIEHGWTIATPPAGDGDLVIAVQAPRRSSTDTEAGTRTRMPNDVTLKYTWSSRWPGVSRPSSSVSRSFFSRHVP